MPPPRLLRQISRLLVRGPDAPFLLAELEEAFERDAERGVPTPKARRRYARNIVASSWHLWRSRMRFPNPIPRTSWPDVKLGLRMLGKQPALTLVAVFALSVGIPASMIPLHLVDSLTVDLPFEEGDQIVGIRNRNIVENRTAIRALHDYFVWKEELSSFEAVGAARSDPYNVISEDGRAAPIRGSEITASAFDILRVRPIMGRTLYDSDQVKGAPNVVVLSHEVWQTRLGGDPDVLGTAIRIGTEPHEVIGVMPPDFMFPMRDLLWLPLRDQPTDFQRGMGPDIITFGRLADGVSLEAARAELETVGLRMAGEYPDTHDQLRPQVRGFTSMIGGVDPSDLAEIYFVQLIALTMLAIVCGNVGTLILARTATRTEEIAVRTALGASRTRIVSQLFVESLILALLATGVGLVIGDRLADAFVARAFVEAPFWFDLGVRPKTVAMALGIAVFCAAIAGVIPALKATGRRVQQNLQQSKAGSGVRFGFGSSALIIAEVALSLGFLALGGAMAGNLVAGVTVDDGVERDQYVMALLRIPWTDHTAVENDLSVVEFSQAVAYTHEELLRRFDSEPGASRLAIGRHLPGMEHPDRRIEFEGQDRSEDFRGYEVQSTTVDIGFFEAFGKAALDGREFTSSDLVGTLEDRPAVIVNSAFVEHVLGGRNAVGRRLRYVVPDDREPGPWYEIIGVVGHLGMNDMDPVRDEGIYHPGAPGEIHPMFVATMVGADPMSFVGRLREIVGEVDPDAMIQYPRALQDVPNGNRDMMRYGTAALVSISSIIILLSAAGLYALMSFTVSQRRREIGIRTALGATPRSIISAIARRAFLQLMVGIALGVVAGKSLIDLTARDAVIHVDIYLLLGGLALFMTLVGVVACLGPTLRGLRIRPVEALKE